MISPLDDLIFKKESWAYPFHLKNKVLSNRNSSLLSFLSPKPELVPLDTPTGQKRRCKTIECFAPKVRNNSPFVLSLFLKKNRACRLLIISLILSLSYKPDFFDIHFAKYGTRIALVWNEESVND
jgi:hypothetical protein